MECPECGKELRNKEQASKHAVSHWGDRPTFLESEKQAKERYEELTE